MRHLKLFLLVAFFIAGCGTAPSVAPGPLAGTSQGLPPAWTATPFLTAAPLPTATTPYSSVRTTLPTEDDTRQLPSIWDFYNLSDGLDLERPGTRDFSIVVAPGETFLWPFYWCSTDEDSLAENLQKISVRFLVDGFSVATSNILEFDRDSQDWRCHYWATMLSGWDPGSRSALTIEYTFREIVNDGRKAYPAGDYSYMLRAEVSEK